jgi:hypothetical protein
MVGCRGGGGGASGNRGNTLPTRAVRLGVEQSKVDTKASK